MLPILIGAGAAAAALFLSGCSKDEDEKSTPKKDPASVGERAIKGVPYKKSCMADAKCEERQRAFAAYDYLGHVYGKNPDSAYDEFLTKGEQAYVNGILGGKRISVKNSLAYFQQEYLEGVSIPVRLTHCQESSSWMMIKASDPKYGKALAIGGGHFCGSMFGKLYRNTQTEQLVAAQPEDWVFFVETSKAYDMAVEAGEDPAREETALFHHIANKLEIPVHNPLIDIYRDPVVAEMEKEGISRMEIAVAVSISMVHAGHMSQPRNAALLKDDPEADMVLYDTLKKFFVPPAEERVTRPDIEDNIKAYGVDREAFFAAAKKAFQAPVGTDRGQHYQALNDRNNQMVKRLGKISNQLSVDRVKALLTESGKTMAFFQIARNHLPILEMVYEDTEVISIQIK